MVSQSSRTPYVWEVWADRACDVDFPQGLQRLLRKVKIVALLTPQAKERAEDSSSSSSSSSSRRSLDWRNCAMPCTHFEIPSEDSFWARKSRIRYRLVIHAEIPGSGIRN